MSLTLDALLSRLETARNRFGRGAAKYTQRLLEEIFRHDFRDAKSLLRFHEATLFLRAFPQGPSVVRRVENLLDTFHRRIEKLRELGADMSAFDDFDTSGIAGTTMQDKLSFEAARWQTQRIPRNVAIAWKDYEEERAMGATWPRFIPLLEEDADVEANIPWRRWLDAARGRERELEWLIRQFEQSPVTDRERIELYDSLHLPLRWELGNLKLSRTRNWARPRLFYYHGEPLITRSEVSLTQELARPAPLLRKLSRSQGEAVLQMVREVMLVRYRELYGTTLGDPRSVVRAELGRGVVIDLWNLPPARRLPLRAYVAGFTLKNGVPINYIEAIGLCEWIEVGFNTFYTYRQGETAWNYAQALRCLCAFTGARVISVYPYQIGQSNDEALDSGAFWFYRKLGFRSGRADLEQLARREEQRIAANRGYRTSRKTLKRLAEAHVFYELDRVVGSPVEASVTSLRNQETLRAVESLRTGKGTTSSRAETAANNSAASAAEGSPGPWDTFSTRNLALRVNQRMAQEFSGDSQRIREASARDVARILRIDPARWNGAQRRSLANWALVLDLIAGLETWSAKEKKALVQIIQAQSAADEMRYLKLTGHHARLRRELLRLGAFEWSSKV